MIGVRFDDSLDTTNVGEPPTSPLVAPPPAAVPLAQNMLDLILTATNDGIMDGDLVSGAAR